MKFLVLFLSIGAVLTGAEEVPISSYSNPVGSSYTVPITKTNSYNAPVSKQTVYSVSADDLERSSDLAAPASADTDAVSPVYSSASSTVQVYSAESRGSPVYTAPSSSFLTSKSSKLPSSFSKTLTSSYSASTGTSSLSSPYKTPGTVASISYNGSPATADYATEKKSAKLENEIESADTAEQRSDVAPTYQAPAVEQTYAAPASTGNLYYYYYPVVPETQLIERDDNELDPLVIILIPITIIIGFLAILSIINVVFVNGRSFTGRQSSESPFGSFTNLQGEVDNLLLKYYEVLESEECMDRVVCELGTKAKNLSGKDYLLRALDWIIPTSLSTRIETFKKSVTQGYEVHECKKYACDSRPLIDLTRRK